MKKLVFLAVTCMTLLTACSSNDDGNMIGAPWTWPGAIVSSGISNAIYDARRNRVKDYITTNFDAITAQARVGEGALLIEAARLAEVPDHRRAELYAQLRDNYATFFDKPTREEAIEAVTVAFMVYSTG
jgi:hypothetical protein